MNDTKTKLSIFDFDGTLIDTALPDKGKLDYERITGKKWPYEGWWGKAESLDTTVFKSPIIKPVIDDYNREKQYDTTVMIMMTGRMVKLKDSVKKILDDKALYFDEYIYNTGGATLDAKLKSLDMLLLKYPSVKIVEMWEDRLEHIKSFEDWGKNHPELYFKINLVEGNHH